MKKVEHTNELDYIFRKYWDIKLLYMDLTEHDNGETYLKVINRKGLTNVYLLENGDDTEKLSARISEIYDSVTKSNFYYNVDSFEKRIRISQELTKKDNVKRSVKTGLYREDNLYRGIFVGVLSISDYKKDCKYISVLPNGTKINAYYDFKRYDTMKEITTNYDNSNTYFLINEEEVTKDFKKAIKALKKGDNVEISNEISWEIQEFENFFYYNSELLHKDEYILTYDNDVVENENAVYCEDIEDYMHCDNAYYLGNEGVYYYDNIDLTYSDLEETYINDNNIAYVIDNQGHEQPVHSENLDSYYFDEDEEIYYTYDAHFRDNIIQDYKKTELPPISSGKKDYFIGVELEMEKEDSTIRERSENIVNVLNESGGDYSPLLEWKKDSSLECGVEMVTAPISLNIFKDRIVPIIEKLHLNGFTSEKGGRCGNHIHISKNAFSEEAQARLILIYAKFEQQIKILSRRGTNNSYCRDVLENFDSLEVENSMRVVNSQKYKGKCTAINFSNKDTIEFRVFRGTMNANRLISNIQLVQLLADWSRKDLTVYEILNLNITDFKNEILNNEYVELFNYCIEKEVI